MEYAITERGRNMPGECLRKNGSDLSLSWGKRLSLLAFLGLGLAIHFSARKDPRIVATSNNESRELTRICPATDNIRDHIG
jgi:hypothetical protein